MGAFLLYPTHRTDLELDACAQHFTRRGFPSPAKITQGATTLWVWPKQYHGELQQIQQGDEWVAFVVGTLVYRGRGRTESLRSLARDAAEGTIAWDELIGSFCAGFWRGGQWKLLTDRMECQPVFVDARSEVACSSFLGLLTALPGKQAINPLAFAEKVATGYIVGPDTLVDSIRKVSTTMGAESSGAGWSFLGKPARAVPERGFDVDREASLERQLQALERYLTSIRALANESPAVLGLSTGYDSRLLFAVACRAGFPLAVQTHATQGVHDYDQRVVSELAGRKGSRAVVIPTRRMSELSPEAFADVLRDCVDFFDGRCSHNMGAFSEVYTRAYSIASLGGFGLRLNGLGGELYRNYYFDSARRVDFRQWMERHVYYPGSRHVLGDVGLWEAMHRRKVAKMATTLGVDLGEPASALVRKRYYCEIRMPECDGANNNAHNQVALYLTPFIEWGIIRTGYGATPFIGRSGRYQAALIERADAEVAAAPSHYGFVLTHEPLRHRIRSWLKSTLPDAYWTRRRERRLCQSDWQGPNVAHYLHLRERFPVLGQVEQAQRDFFPGIKWLAAQTDYAQGPTCTFLGTWLRDYQSKLRL